MRAVVQDRYGPPSVLHIEEVPTPVPGDDEVLVRVRASTVTQSDTHLRAANPFFWRFFAGMRRPRIRTLGVELAGEVAAIGAAVREFQVGDRVFGGPRGFGAHAELVCLKESGPIAHVTAICNTKNVEIVRSLGPDVVIDYTVEDFTKNEQGYDAIIDAVGKYAYHWGRRGLRPGGIYVETDLGPHKVETLAMLLITRWFGTKRLVFAGGFRNKADVLFAKSLIEAGAYRPVIDRRYPLEQVAEAHTYVETWQKTGNVVLIMSDTGS